MGDINDPTPVLLLLAVSTRYQEALAWAEERSVSEFGPLALESTAFDFTETDYYQATMGSDLRKQFLAFEQLIDPDRLPEIKRGTNQWELDYARESAHEEARPLNIDPGYLTLAKLVLVSTKDHAHRIYLSQGIYAEVTLNYRAGKWQACDWTYPDFRRADYQEFFSRCRERIRARTI